MTNLSKIGQRSFHSNLGLQEVREPHSTPFLEVLCQRDSASLLLCLLQVPHRVPQGRRPMRTRSADWEISSLCQWSAWTNFFSPRCGAPLSASLFPPLIGGQMARRQGGLLGG